ncbi:MAG: hypothetical protein F6K22_37500 [Okeania sp. SIO2F4]|nr:hypothetical protein [Okeania sp. SIO2F4]
MPKSMPICLLVGLSLKSLMSSTLKDTDHLPLGSSLAVIVLGTQPGGSCLFHLMGNGSAPDR